MKVCRNRYIYEAADGWKTLLKAAYFPSILIIVILACAFLVSGIFSVEFKYKADSVFFAAKLGRSKAITSKIYAGISTITAVYWFEVILFTLIVLATLGINGTNCLIQTDADNWHSIYNITFFQEYLLQSWAHILDVYLFYHCQCSFRYIQSKVLWQLLFRFSLCASARFLEGFLFFQKL